MVTTIQISEDLKKTLEKRKLFPNETYENVIWDLIDSSTEISEETKRAIKIGEQQIREGKTHSLEKVRKELGL